MLISQPPVASLDVYVNLRRDGSSPYTHYRRHAIRKYRDVTLGDLRERLFRDNGLSISGVDPVVVKLYAPGRSSTASDITRAFVEADADFGLKKPDLASQQHSKTLQKEYDFSTRIGSGSREGYCLSVRFSKGHSFEAVVFFEVCMQRQQD